MTYTPEYLQALPDHELNKIAFQLDGFVYVPEPDSYEDYWQRGNERWVAPLDYVTKMGRKSTINYILFHQEFPEQTTPAQDQPC